MSDKGILPDVMTFNRLVQGLCKWNRCEDAKLSIVSARVYTHMQVKEHDSTLLALHKKFLPWVQQREGLLRYCDTPCSILVRFHLTFSASDFSTKPDHNSYHLQLQQLFLQKSKSSQCSNSCCFQIPSPFVINLRMLFLCSIKYSRCFYRLFTAIGRCS